MEEYMNIAINEAKKAYKNGDIPVGALIIRNNIVIAKAYNKKENKKISTRHAEIEVIEKACKKIKTWHLDDCEIYITMEPCSMCYNAILQSRIKKITYGVQNKNFGYISISNNSIQNSKVEIISGVLADKIEKLLKEFFKQMRNKK